MIIRTQDFKEVCDKILLAVAKSTLSEFKELSK